MLSAFSQFIFGSSGLFGGHHGSSARSSSWKDKSLCFDLRQSDLELNHGEQLIACFFPIEDIKGNQEEPGILKVTNLRLIWICCDRRRVNLSIGWRTVSLTFEQNLKDSLGSSVTSLCVLTKYESTKYEFIFNKMSNYSGFWSNEPQEDDWNSMLQLRRFITNQEKSSVIDYLTPMYLDDPFEVVFKVWTAYKKTHLFRHCRANLTHLLQDSCDQTKQPANTKSNEINKLPDEEIIDVYMGVIQAESRSVKHTGTLTLTNIRLVWVDESLPLRNLSIPYIRIDSMKIKQGDRLIIDTHDYLATSNLIELCVQKTTNQTQANKAKLMFEQVQNLFNLYKNKPKFGPESCEECQNFMSHLRSIEHYFQSFERLLENLGPEVSRNDSKGLQERTFEVPAVHPAGKDESGLDNLEYNENALNKYSAKLNNYLNERPISCDGELIYSTDLGLAIERPNNDVELERIWRLDL